MVLKAKGIVKLFGNLEVLSGVDFEAREQEVVSIMGASGAGKSTLLQILGTLMRPDSGTLEIAGEEPLKMGEKALAAFRNRHVGFVFQAHHLLPEFTALENVMLPSLIGGASPSDAKEKAAALLETVGLGGRFSHKPSQLSGGEQQRVAIARALVNDPEIIFADEPSGNLDSKTKEGIHSLFLSLGKQAGRSIVIVTHDEGLARLCDKCWRLSDGLFL